MLRWAFIFLIIALIAGALGLTEIAGVAAFIARILFFLFLILFLAMLILGFLIV